MKFKFLSVVALAAVVITGLGTNPVAAEGGALSVEQLGDALTPYGKNTTTTNGHTSYSITVPSGKWQINVILSISPNGRVIWMTNNLSRAEFTLTRRIGRGPRPGRAPRETAARRHRARAPSRSIASPAR